MSSRIIIEDYDPLWPQRFETLRSQIADTLGDLASAIEHIGSTAVPGLAAKPIVDIDVLLRSSTDLSLVISRLASLGYEHRSDLGIPGREAFRRPPDAFPHHLYVCPPDSREYRQHIAFRDHLRTHPEDAKAYAVLKHNLASTSGDRREAYNEGKGEFVENIVRRALQDPAISP
jgi:GrpB-like predicted nucleotidyltransferase (UPF0157 family)